MLDKPILLIKRFPKDDDLLSPLPMMSIAAATTAPPDMAAPDMAEAEPDMAVHDVAEVDMAPVEHEWVQQDANDPRVARRRQTIRNTANAIRQGERNADQKRQTYNTSSRCTVASKRHSRRRHGIDLI